MALSRRCRGGKARERDGGTARSLHLSAGKSGQRIRVPQAKKRSAATNGGRRKRGADKANNARGYVLGTAFQKRLQAVLYHSQVCCPCCLGSLPFSCALWSSKSVAAQGGKSLPPFSPPSPHGREGGDDRKTRRHLRVEWIRILHARRSRPDVSDG